MKRILFPLALLIGALLSSCLRQDSAKGIPDADLSTLGKLLEPAGRAPSPEELAKTMFTVGDRTVTFWDLLAERQRLAQAAGIPPERMAEMRDQGIGQARDNLMLRNLLVIGAEREGLAATPEDLNRRIEEVQKSLPPGKTLEEWLAAQSLPREKLESLLRLEIVESKIQEKLAATVPEPTDEEIASFYSANPHFFAKPEGLKAETLQIVIPQGASPDMRRQLIALAETLRERLAKGEALDALKGSIPPNARHGTAFLERSKTEENLAPHIFKLKPGEVSDVLVVGGVCHVFRAIEAQEKGMASLLEAREQIVARIREEKVGAKLLAYAKEIRATIEIKDAEGRPMPKDGAEPKENPAP